MHIHVLVPTPTVGCYYTEQVGEAQMNWATVLGPGMKCAECGETFRSGYVRADLHEADPSTYVCAKHIHVEYKPTTEHISDKIGVQTQTCIARD